MEKKANNQSLSEIFNIPSLESKKTEVAEIDSTTDADFEFARQNLIEIITAGKDSLSDLSDLAAQSQHPRFFETLSLLMNTMLDAQERLLKLRKAKQDLNGSTTNPQTINNTLVISSAEMLEKIKEAKNKTIDNEE